MKSSRVLLQPDDYHHRRLYAKEFLPFYKSRSFRHNFFLALFLHLPFLLGVFFWVPQAIKPMVQIVLQKTEVKKIENFQRDQQNMMDEKKITQAPVAQNQKIAQEKNIPPAQPPQENNSSMSQNHEAQNFQNEFEKNLFAARKNPTSPATPVQSSPPVAWQTPPAEQASLLKKNPNEKNEHSFATEKEGEQIRWQGKISRKAVYIPQPQYPEYYLAKGIQAKGVFSIEVDFNGAVIGVFTLRSTGYPGLDVEAKNALRSARFSAIADTKRIDKGDIDVEFKLR